MMSFYSDQFQFLVTNGNDSSTSVIDSILFNLTLLPMQRKLGHYMYKVSALLMICVLLQAALPRFYGLAPPHLPLAQRYATLLSSPPLHIKLNFPPTFSFFSSSLPSSLFVAASSPSR